MSRLIYLAGAYSYNPEAAYELHLSYTHQLMQSGLLVFSPIVHNHLLAKTYSLPADYTYWKKHNREMIMRCNELYVMTEKGWEASKGTQYEMEVADEHNIPIRYIRMYNNKIYVQLMKCSML